MTKTTANMIFGFMAIWLLGWIGNGLFGSSFDLTALRDIFTFVLTKYGIDSWLNTKHGDMP